MSRYTSKNGLVTTIAASADGQINYAMEGSVFVAGAVIQWVRDELRFVSASEDSEYFARKVKDNGGASADNFLAQFQADIINASISRPVVRETTALGAALLAGLAVGVWKSADEVRESWTLDARFTPRMEQEKRDRYLDEWHKAVRCVGGWAR